MPGTVFCALDLDTGRSVAPASWPLETDGRGGFLQALDETSVVSVEVTGAGYVPCKLTTVVVGVDTEIELHAASRLVVEVRYDHDGDGTALEPLEGAACRLILDGGNRLRRTIQHGTTDERGEVVLAPRGREADVVVEAPDLPSFRGSYELEAGQDRVQVVLRPVGEVSGRVIDERTGQPIADATVMATHRDDLRAITDAEGMFRVVRDLRSLWTVSHPDYASVHSFWCLGPRVPTTCATSSSRRAP